MDRRKKIASKAGFWMALAIMAALLSVYTWLFVQSMLKDLSWAYLITLLFLWQTQIAGTLAIVAGIIGAATIFHQTTITQRLDETRRVRRARALHAILPLILTELTDYADACLQINLELLAQSNGSITNTVGLQFPTLPTGLVDRLIELIETNEANHAKPFIILVRRIQIQHARARNIQTQGSNQQGSLLLKSNIISGIIDTSEIHARCSKLFIYARADANEPASEIFAKDIRESLRVMTFLLSNMDQICLEVEPYIERRSNASQSGTAWPEL